MQNPIQIFPLMYSRMIFSRMRFRLIFSRQIGAATVLIFLNAFVPYFHLEHVQRISFCRCFLIVNPAVFLC